MKSRFFNLSLLAAVVAVDGISYGVGYSDGSYGQEKGVTIRSWPAIHSLDGPVSFSLEWKGLKFVFSSDTYPNKWFIEYAQDADLVIHECFIAVPDLVAKMGFTPESALRVGTQVHTAPEAFGKVMSAVTPRMAVAYHFFKDNVYFPNTEDLGPDEMRVIASWFTPV